MFELTSLLTNEFLIEFLIFILVFFVTFQALKRIFKNKIVSIVIGLSVSLLCIFYLSYSNLNFLVKTYSLTGIIILTLVPFVIAFFFIYTSDISSLIRKMFWVFYGIIVILILQKNNFLSSETTTSVTLLIIFIIIVLLLLDVAIKNKLNVAKNLKRSY